jgi:hypothetical protein
MDHLVKHKSLPNRRKPLETILEELNNLPQAQQIKDLAQKHEEEMLLYSSTSSRTFQSDPSDPLLALLPTSGIWRPTKNLLFLSKITPFRKDLSNDDVVRVVEKTKAAVREAYRDKATLSAQSLSKRFTFLRSDLADKIAKIAVEVRYSEGRSLAGKHVAPTTSLASAPQMLSQVPESSSSSSSSALTAALSTDSPPFSDLLMLASVATSSSSSSSSSAAPYFTTSMSLEPPLLSPAPQSSSSSSSSMAPYFTTSMSLEPAYNDMAEALSSPPLSSVNSFPSATASVRKPQKKWNERLIEHPIRKDIVDLHFEKAPDKLKNKFIMTHINLQRHLTSRSASGRIVCVASFARFFLELAKGYDETTICHFFTKYGNYKLKRGRNAGTSLSNFIPNYQPLVEAIVKAKKENRTGVEDNELLTLFPTSAASQALSSSLLNKRRRDGSAVSEIDEESPPPKKTKGNEE